MFAPRHTPCARESLDGRQYYIRLRSDRGTLDRRYLWGAPRQRVTPACTGRGVGKSSRRRQRSTERRLRAWPAGDGLTPGSWRGLSHRAIPANWKHIPAGPLSPARGLTPIPLLSRRFDEAASPRVPSISSPLDIADPGQSEPRRAMEGGDLRLSPLRAPVLGHAHSDCGGQAPHRGTHPLRAGDPEKT